MLALHAETKSSCYPLINLHPCSLFWQNIVTCIQCTCMDYSEQNHDIWLHFHFQTCTMYHYRHIMTWLQCRVFEKKWQPNKSSSSTTSYKCAYKKWVRMKNCQSLLSNIYFSHSVMLLYLHLNLQHKTRISCCSCFQGFTVMCLWCATITYHRWSPGWNCFLNFRWLFPLLCGPRPLGTEAPIILCFSLRLVTQIESSLCESLGPGEK